MEELEEKGRLETPEQETAAEGQEAAGDESREEAQADSPGEGEAAASGEEGAMDESGGPEQPTGETYTNSRGREVRLMTYDFRRPIQLSKGFFRSLSMVSETFAKLLTLSLSNYLHVPVTVTTSGVRQIVFEDHTKGIANPSFINILDMSPIKIPGMMDLDLGLVFTMIEKLLGSHSLSNDIRREFTTIEMRIARKIVLRMLTDLREAMLRILEVDVSLTSIEHNPDFTYIMNANDPCIRLDFEVELIDFTGPMSICISLAALDAEMGGDGPSPYRDVRDMQERQEDELKLGRILDGTGSEVVVELGKRKITLEELEELEVGGVLRLRKQVSEPLTITLGGTPLFEGKMGRYKQKAAVKITRIHKPVKQRLVEEHSTV